MIQIGLIRREIRTFRYPTIKIYDDICQNSFIFITALEEFDDARLINKMDMEEKCGRQIIIKKVSQDTFNALDLPILQFKDIEINYHGD